ncbi:hypothetical protein GCM10008983_07820 [Lentibacillus halophilus]|uniref:Uncharacterized protein n=1 Tax=Lentibacillus halophilus TaxID=295065 RepID=A0ABP3IZ17_9BACI
MLPVMLIGAICTFASVLSAIYAIRAIINKQDKQNYSILIFISAIFAAIAYFMLFISH